MTDTARTDLDLTSRLHFTLDARAVGPIDQAPKIGSYQEAGGEIAFDATKRIELFLAGRNLLHATHLESNDPTGAQRARRAIYAGARARF